MVATQASAWMNFTKKSTKREKQAIAPGGGDLVDYKSHVGVTLSLLQSS